MDETQLLRKKGTRNLGIPDCYQAEAAVGLGLVFRAGINVGELLDFALGWSTLDIFGDDLETGRRRNTLQTAADEQSDGPSSGDP